MNKEQAIQILVNVAKKFLEKEMPPGVIKLLLSDQQLKVVYKIQEAIELLDTSKKEPERNPNGNS